MKNLCGLILVSVVFFGCEQYLEVDLPDQEPKLVVNSLLESKDTLKVYLTQSIGVLDEWSYGDSFDPVLGAHVEFTDESGGSKVLAYREESTYSGMVGYYFLTEFQLKENESYRISAASDGMQDVSSEVVYPELVPIKDVTYFRLGASEYSTEMELVEFTVLFDDLPSSNYYEISGSYYGKSTLVDNHYFSGDLYPEPVNPLYDKELTYQSRGVLFQDVLLQREGAEFKFRSTIPRNADLDVTIMLSQVSPSFYQYERTLGLQINNEGDILSQPVLVYNNIENGLGIWRARTTDKKVLKMLLED